MDRSHGLSPRSALKAVAVCLTISAELGNSMVGVTLVKSAETPTTRLRVSSILYMRMGVGGSLGLVGMGAGGALGGLIKIFIPAS